MNWIAQRYRYGCMSSRLLLCAVTVYAASVAAADGQPAPAVFDVSQRIHLAPSSNSTWAVPLEAGEFLDVDVRQKADLLVRLLSPDGKELSTSDGFDGPDARGRIFWIANETGSYSLRVEGDRFGGEYVLTVRKRRPGDVDRSLLLAQDFFRRAHQSLKKGAAGADQAAELLQQMATSAREAGDIHLQTMALLWRCHAVRLRGRHSEELLNAREALAFAEREKDELLQSLALYHIGIGLYQSGRFSQGLESLRRSADLSQRGGRELASAMANSLIASLLQQIGVHDDAEERAKRALAVFAKYDNERGKAATHLTIGGVNTDRKNFDRASREFQEALAIYRRLEDPINEAICLRDLGTVAGLRGDFREAARLLREAQLRMGEKAPKVAVAAVLRALGHAYLRLDLRTDADRTMMEALRLSIEASSVPGEASARMGMARVASANGDLVLAKSYAEESLSLVESLRQTLTEEGLRADHLSAQRSYFSFYVGLLERMHREQPGNGYAELAFEASERSRARGLVEFLQRNKIALDARLDPALAKRRTEAQARLQELAAQQTRLLMKPETAEKAAALKDTIAEARVELERVQGLTRAANPAYASVAEFRSVTVPELQSTLDEDSVLVEYLCTPERTYIWAISRTRVRLVSTAGLKELESEVRTNYAALTARNKLLANVPAEARQKQLAASAAEAVTTSQRLSSLLLDPIRKDLEGKRVVLIVPDLPLSYVAFAALQDPSAPEQPLIARRQLVILPSASVLSAIRSSAALRPRPTRQLAIFADPIFQPADSRLKNPGSDPGSKAGLRAGGAREASFALERLPYTRREASAISSLVDPSERMVALDLDANRDRAMSGELSAFRILHFATHSVLDGEFPDASGIVLSMVDRQGKHTDGVLRLEDIYGMKLNADLVTLSACQTALGTKLNAEGFTGLARGMLYAGASRVVATLWKVDDAATAEWMRLFYYAMLRQGKSPGEALQHAQTTMAATKRWASPYYWAGFVLIGQP